MATASLPSQRDFGFPSKGALRRTPFSQLVREIAQRSLSGSLYLLNGKTKKVVFFVKGQPVFVRSNVLAECLGQILAREGLITAEECERTLKATRRTGKKQGELLVEMGILSEGNLRYGLETQLRAKLFEVFSWVDGRYQFKADPPDLPFGVRLHLRPEGVILGGIVDRYDEKRARQALNSHLERYPSVEESALGDDPAQFELLPEELHFARGLDGSKPLQEVLEGTPRAAVPSVSVLILGLSQAGLLTFLRQSQKARADLPALPLHPPGSPDDDLPLVPQYNAEEQPIADFEDTPIPGQLPKAPGLLDEHEADFADVEADEDSSESEAEVEDLFAAEPDSIEETFEDDQIEPLDEDFEIVDRDIATHTSAPLLNPEDIATMVDPDDQDDDAGFLTEFGRPDSEGVTIAGFAEQEEEYTVHSTGTPPSQAPPEPTAFGYESESVVRTVHGSRPTPLEARRTERRPSAQPRPSVAHADDPPLDLLSFDELDQIELPDLDAPLSSDVEELEPEDIIESSVGEIIADEDLIIEPTSDDMVEDSSANSVDSSVDSSLSMPSERAEVLGAMRFSEGEAALTDGQYSRAVRLLEDAYDNGFDVAELHAMLGYARFMASGQDQRAAQHALEMLDYAKDIDPNLDLIYAYRGAILRAIGHKEDARRDLEQAIQLNPYCELARRLLSAED